MEARTRPVILLGLVLLALPGLAGAAAPADSLLQAARTAAAADEHLEAIALYDGAVATDSSLATPLAGERAFQHLWADELAAALSLFETALADAPEREDLLLGRARCLNWMGRHDEAAAAYSDFLAAHPGVEEAELGLAQAERWRGREDRALAILESAHWPIQGERREIRDAIRADTAPWLELAGGKIHDSDPTDRPWFSASLGAYLDPRLALEFSLGRAGFDGYGYEAPSTRLGAGLVWRPAARWALHLNTAWEHYAVDFVDAYAASDPPDPLSVDYSLLTADGWLTWRPQARLRLDLGAFRQPGPTPLALARENSLSGLNAGADLELARHWTLVLGGGLATYDDGNHRRSARSALRWTRALAPALDAQLEPELRWLDFSRQDGVGYWSPNAVRAWGLRLRLSGELGKGLDWRLEGGGGREQERDAEAVSVGDWSAELGLALGRKARLSAAGGSGKSRLDSAGGYQREWWSLGLRTALR